MLKNFIQFVREQVEEKPAIVRFNLSNKFITQLRSMGKEYKLADLYLKLPGGVPSNELTKDPVNYITSEEDGSVSFLKPRFFEECSDALWNNTRRQKMKISKAIKEIYNQPYLDSYLKQTDIENFVNKWSVLLKPATVIELRGDDVLRAYNYKREMDPFKFGFTCANFGQKEPGGSKYDEPLVEWFDIYTKNPENCGAVIVMDQGKIVGRRTFQQGIQTKTHGDYKQGEFYTIWGNYYGEGGGGKYDIMIKDYLRNKYNAKDKSNEDGIFRIKLKETRFKRYCPFDSMYVNFQTNELANRQPIDGTWTRTYKATCPYNIVRQRLEEEKKKKEEEKSIDDTPVKVLDPETIT